MTASAPLMSNRRRTPSARSPKRMKVAVRSSTVTLRLKSPTQMRETASIVEMAREEEIVVMLCVGMREIVVLPSVLLMDYVGLVVGEYEGTSEKKCKRVNKKPVLRLMTLARLDQYLHYLSTYTRQHVSNQAVLLSFLPNRNIIVVPLRSNCS